MIFLYFIICTHKRSYSSDIIQYRVDKQLHNSVLFFSFREMFAIFRDEFVKIHKVLGNSCNIYSGFEIGYDAAETARSMNSNSALKKTRIKNEINELHNAPAPQTTTSEIY